MIPPLSRLARALTSAPSAPTLAPSSSTPAPSPYAQWSARAEVVALAGVRPYLRGDIAGVRVVVVGEVAGVVCVLLRVPGSPSLMARVRVVAWGDFERAIEAGGVEGARGVEGVRYGV